VHIELTFLLNRRFIKVTLFLENLFHFPLDILPNCSFRARSRAADINIHYGSRRVTSRGNMVVSRTFCSSNNRMVSRSRPIPRPPWGGIPYLNIIK